MNRAVKALGTNVAFRGLAVNPYLALSLRPPPALPQPVITYQVR